MNSLQAKNRRWSFHCLSGAAAGRIFSSCGTRDMSSLFSFAVTRPRVLAPPPNVIDEAMIVESVELERKLDEQLASALSKEPPEPQGA